jgi:inosine-uridine nucleoside N-ribohydrolase
MTVKVLLDTDIGSDIDDAVALAYLLAQPECELLGITTVSGEVEKRAQIASAICKAAGKNIPIFPGRDKPLLKAQMQGRAPQSAALKRWPHVERFPHGEAIPFLDHEIRSHPGEVILLTIGPLTNIAALFASDEEIPSLLKGIVSMCGIFSNRVPGAELTEWNAMLDPHATAIVYHSQVKIHESIGLDVTMQVKMDAREVRRRFQVPRLKPVLDFAEIWFQERDEIIFHDPLAATTLFDEKICKFERGQVDVELASERLAGLTYLQSQPSGRHTIATEVAADYFFDHYFSVCS